MSFPYRQGDVRFLQPDTRNASILAARSGTVIVAGEATVHAHRLRAGTIQAAPVGTLYLDLSQTTQVVHEEHGPLVLEPSLWPVRRQHEDHPEAIREVRE